MTAEKATATATTSVAGVWQGALKWGSRSLALIGAGAVGSMALSAYIRYKALKADKLLPEEWVLELDLERLNVVEAPPSSPLALLGGQAANQVPLRQLVKALQWAKDDPRCRGVLAYMGRREGLGGMAAVQELRDAMADFRATASQRGASAVAYAPAFGEAGQSSSVPYYLASAFDKVYLQPTGSVGLTGLEATSLFLRGALDKLKVRPWFFTREEYKTAANMFTQTDFTPQHRENTTQLLQGLHSQIISGASQARGVAPSALQAHADAGPLLGPEALQAGVVDGLKYKDEVQSLFMRSKQAKAKGQAGASSSKEEAKEGGSALEPKAKALGVKPELAAAGAAAAEEQRRRMRRVPVTKYIQLMEAKEAAELSQKHPAPSWLSSERWRAVAEGLRPEPGQGQGEKPATGTLYPGRPPRIAVVHAVGAIVQGPVVPKGPRPPQQMVDASKLSSELEKLAADEGVAAVVLRINSPGGSALGSDTLHRAVQRLKQAGKPVVVSFGDVAASGGYYMACGADKIVAQPGTITGSIGVVVGKFNVRGLLSDLGVNPSSIGTAANVSMLSPFTDLSPEQEAYVAKAMDAIYYDFLGKVAAGRGRTVEEIKPLAGGRVYTGEEAHRLGLVDKLGGLQQAVDLAKEAAGLPADPQSAQVVEYPPRKLPLLLRAIQGAMPSDAMRGAAASVEAGASSWGLKQGLDLLQDASPDDASAGASVGSGMDVVSPVVAAVVGPAAAAALSVAPGGQKVLKALGETLGHAALLDGSVCMYSMDAQVLAECA